MKALSPPRARRRSLVVVADTTVDANEQSARALAGSLEDMGFDVVFLGREPRPRSIAAEAVAAAADAIDLFLPTTGGVRLLRGLLHELRALGHHDIGIVVHRIG